MTGYVARLDTLRAALGGLWEVDPAAGYYGPVPYQPRPDALLRRLAERLSDDQCADVVELIRLARGDP